MKISNRGGNSFRVGFTGNLTVSHSNWTNRKVDTFSYILAPTDFKTGRKFIHPNYKFIDKTTLEKTLFFAIYKSSHDNIHFIHNDYCPKKIACHVSHEKHRQFTSQIPKTDKMMIIQIDHDRLWIAANLPNSRSATINAIRTPIFEISHRTEKYKSPKLCSSKNRIPCLKQCDEHGMHHTRISVSSFKFHFGWRDRRRMRP